MSLSASQSTCWLPTACLPALLMLIVFRRVPPSEGGRQTRMHRRAQSIFSASTTKRCSTLPATKSAAAMSPPPHTEASQRVSFLCGLGAGVAQAGVFNPFDRALYLSVKHHRPFLSYENFAQPYSGFLQSVGGRALSGGLYYPLERVFMNYVPPDGDPMLNFLAGTAAGAMNALILNPLSALKYKTWGREVNRGMPTEALNMWHKAGLRPFYNGLLPTLLRDVVFGGCYTYLRYEWIGHNDIPAEHQWVGNLVAAAVATIASGPFNLARNVQYATQSKTLAPTIPQVLARLVAQTAAQETLGQKWHYLQGQLRIGWGTARVAVGMAFGNHIYDQCMMAFEQEATNQHCAKAS